MQRLREIREWRERYGMGVAGGPVRVQAQPEPEPADLLELPPADQAAPDEGPKVARPGEATIDLHLDWE
jgi:hypothetical protein